MDSTRTFDMMGGKVEYTLYDAPKRFVDSYFRGIVLEERRLEGIFSVFDPESELSRLNRERSLTVSDELGGAISMGLGFSRETHGAYDITLGKAIAARKRGGDDEGLSCSYKDVRINGTTVSLSHDDVVIDLGSIAKGYIVDRLLDYMREIGLRGGFIDARGDMRNYGGVEIVEIENPRNPSQRSKPIVLDNLAVATSGDYKQYFGDFEKSHIIGCRHFASVTAVAETLALADAVATCVSVLDQDEAQRFMSRNSKVKVFAYGKDMTESHFNGFESLGLDEVLNAA